MIDETTYQLMEQYLRGELPDAERVAFETRLAADATLREELDWLRIADETMHDVGHEALKRRIAALTAGIAIGQLDAYTPSQNAIPPKKSWWSKGWWTLPFGVLLGLSIWVLTSKHKTTEGNHYFHPQVIPLPDTLSPFKDSAFFEDTVIRIDTHKNIIKKIQRVEIKEMNRSSSFKFGNEQRYFNLPDSCGERIIESPVPGE